MCSRLAVAEQVDHENIFLESPLPCIIACFSDQ